MPTGNSAYAELAKQLKQLMSDIRASAAYLKSKHGYALATLARVTGLHKNSIMKLDRPDWKPNEETLGRLEILIERADAKRAGTEFDDENVARGRPVGSSSPTPARVDRARDAGVLPARPTPRAPVKAKAPAKAARPATKPTGKARPPVAPPAKAKPKETSSSRRTGKTASLGHAARAN